MVGKTKAATAKEKAAIFREVERGCICCRMIGLYSQAQWHHIVEGRKRLGAAIGLALCPWHHQGITEPAIDLGPSLAISKRDFVERFGTERELYESTETSKEFPWPESKIMARRI